MHLCNCAIGANYSESSDIGKYLPVPFEDSLHDCDVG